MLIFSELGENHLLNLPNGNGTGNSFSNVTTGNNVSYARCPLMTRILNHWEKWCRGEPDPAPPADADTADFFWGV